jgi:RNA polymerase subunit RPABC4/transcription elongation factor Spt4
MATTVLFQGETLESCNDCDMLVFVGEELCGSCYEDQMRAEEWEAMHPEHRCPPRE